MDGIGYSYAYDSKSLYCDVIKEEVPVQRALVWLLTAQFNGNQSR